MKPVVFFRPLAERRINYADYLESIAAYLCGSTVYTVCELDSLWERFLHHGDSVFGKDARPC